MFILLETKIRFHGLKSSFAYHFFLPLGQRCSCTGHPALGNCWKSHEETKKTASFEVDLITEWFMSSPPTFGLSTHLLAVHPQETAAQSPRPGGFGALLVPVIPDKCLLWISEDLRDQGRLPAVQQDPRHECSRHKWIFSCSGIDKEHETAEDRGKMNSQQLSGALAGAGHGVGWL